MGIMCLNASVILRFYRELIWVFFKKRLGLKSENCQRYSKNTEPFIIPGPPVYKLCACKSTDKSVGCVIKYLLLLFFVACVKLNVANLICVNHNRQKTTTYQADRSPIIKFYRMLSSIYVSTLVIREKQLKREENSINVIHKEYLPVHSSRITSLLV